MPTTSVSASTCSSSCARAGTGLRLDPHLAVRHDVIVGVAGVDRRLEDLDLLAGDLRAAQPADQLLALAAEHAADDDFDPALIGLCGRRPCELSTMTGHGDEPCGVPVDSYARDRYSPVSVLTRIMSPVLTNGGTLHDQPGFERGRLDLVARRRALDARAPCRSP